MKNFTFYVPTYFVFGRDTEKETVKYVQRFGGKKLLIHYGGGLVIRSGLLACVKDGLDSAGTAYVELGGEKLSENFQMETYSAPLYIVSLCRYPFLCYDQWSIFKFKMKLLQVISWQGSGVVAEI